MHGSTKLKLSKQILAEIQRHFFSLSTVCCQVGVNCELLSTQVSNLQQSTNYNTNYEAWRQSFRLPERQQFRKSETFVYKRLFDQYSFANATVTNFFTTVVCGFFIDYVSVLKFAPGSLHVYMQSLLFCDYFLTSKNFQNSKLLINCLFVKLWKMWELEVIRGDFKTFLPLKINTFSSLWPHLHWNTEKCIG